MEVLLALSPILWLILALPILKITAWKACMGAFAISMAVAVGYYGKDAMIMGSGALEGVALAIWPILLIITTAIFAYNLVVHTKAMETIKAMLSSVTSDMRVLAILLAWGFGAFMEGMAGFGTAVAIPAAMMVGLGFNPLRSILACLVANSVPTTYGSVAIPVTTLGSLTGLDPHQLGLFITTQLFILNLVTPFFIVGILGGGVKAIKGVFLITLASGLALAVPQYAINYFLGPELSVIACSITIMATVVIMAKLLPPNDPEYRFESDARTVGASEGVVAAMPFILIFLFLVFSSKLFPAIYGPLASVKTSVQIYQGPNAKPYTFMWLANAGVMIFSAAFIGGLIQRAGVGEILGVFGRTLKQLRLTYVTIIAVVMTAKVMTYSGMIAAIANALVLATGAFYPFFAPVIGGLGAFLTGSGTNSNVLFGVLQATAGAKLHPESQMLSYWLASSSSGSAGIGKMLAPQSIAIAVGAVGPALEEYLKANPKDEATANEMRSTVEVSYLMKKVVPYFLIYLLVACTIGYVGAGIFVK